MRVVAGKYRSRKLKGPGKLLLRPTSDLLRETLFNVLGPSVQDSLFLDLYAGTGAIGIEAISRGARQVIFVESDAASVRLVRENLQALEIGGAEIILGGVLPGLEKIAERHLVADFIFLDPPYKETREHLRVLEFLDESHLVAPYGIVIAEHHWKMELPERLNRLERTRILEQGEAALSFYRLAATA